MNTALLLVVGGIAGGVIVALMWWLDADSFRAFLERKAEPENRSPLWLRGKRYFILPERELHALRLMALGNRARVPGDTD